MPKKMGVNTKAEAARAHRSAVKADRHDRNARTKGEAYWQAAEGPKSRSARRHEEDAEKSPRTAASPSSSSSSSPPPRGAPTARLCASVAPSSPRSPRPSCCAAARRSGSGSSVRPRPPRSGRRAPPTRSSSTSCSSPTPTGTTPSSRRGRWRTPSPRCPSLLSLRSRRIATPSAASRSRTRLLKKQSLQSLRKKNLV